MNIPSNFQKEILNSKGKTEAFPEMPQELRENRESRGVTTDGDLATPHRVAKRFPG